MSRSGKLLRVLWLVLCLGLLAYALVLALKVSPRTQTKETWFVPSWGVETAAASFGVSSIQKDTNKGVWYLM